MSNTGRFYVRWKVVDLRITGEKLWSVVRLENNHDPVEVGRFPSLHEAWEVLERDRCSVKTTNPAAFETHSPQTFAEPGVWS